MLALDDQQQAARDWFESLRDRICAAFEAIEQEAGSDAGHPTCDGVSLGVIQQRIRYAESQVVEPATCRSETQSRTCTESGFSAWSGGFQAESCAVSTVRSCGATVSGGTESRQLYPVAKTDDYTKCAPETQTRTCTDGTWSDWSGSAQNETQGGGENIFGALYQDEARLEQFLAAMAGLQLGNFTALANTFDFSKHKTVVDIGGANGLACRILAERHPHLSLMTYDLPAVAPVAHALSTL